MSQFDLELDLDRGVNVSPVVVTIPANVRQLLELYITQCKYEISGLGTVESRDGELEVTGIYLLEQVVTSGDTVLSQEAVAEFLAEAPRRGIDLSKIRLWWHSHAALSSYWSSTDEATIDSFDSAPWFVSIVGNHAGDYKARVDFFPTEPVPVRLGQSATLETIHPSQEVEKVRDEIAARVSKAPAPTYSSTGKGSSKSKPKRQSKRRTAGSKTQPKK
jgi:hypothetical protein